MTTTQHIVVRANKPRVTVTYNCPTARWALKKLSDFRAGGHDSIIITGPDGQPLAEADLFAMVNNDAGSLPRTRRRSRRYRSEGTKLAVPLREVSAA